MKLAWIRCLLVIQITAVTACSASAHPHMFFDSSAQFVLDDKGRLSKLRVVFLVDELNTLYTLAELNVNKDGDGTLTWQETEKIAQTVLKGFGYHHYFTYLRDEKGEVPLGKPLSVTAQLQKKRLGLAFVIPLKKPYPLGAKSLALQLYDPTYFTAITIDLTPTVVGAAVSCSIAVIQPNKTAEARRRQTLLSQLSREQTPTVENVGALFAQTTRVTCQN